MKDLDLLEGPNPSYLTSSYVSEFSSLLFFTALSILSFGIFCDLAKDIAERSLGFDAGSGIPNFAATVISLEIFANNFALFLSCAPFRY